MLKPFTKTLKLHDLNSVERLINVHIEKLPEGYYLATSDALPGLIAQAPSLSETLEIAQDVAKQLLAAMADRNQLVECFPMLADEFDCPLILTR
nr:type II toxin-antitoxin system HicB family antitoxin [Chamaesiphon sp. VAR_48_metabat_135_sub]